MLCGLAYCPVMVKIKMAPIRKEFELSKNIEGSTPPAIFVGRYGYPKVMAGPLLPPVFGDTSEYDTPENWANSSIDDVLRFRLSMVRGMSIINAKEASNPSNAVSKLQEISMSAKSSPARMITPRKVSSNFTFDFNTAPFGPTVSFDTLQLDGNLKIDSRFEKTYYDHDQNATSAIGQLYREGVPISGIQRVLSSGSLGVRKRRRMVPTRWSITAIDDTISKQTIKQLKGYPEVGEYMVFLRNVHKNMFAAIVIPGAWSFEWIEAWFPNTTWNMMHEGEAELMGDHEGYFGRRTYAKVGGCYYSSRLATSEFLTRIRRQAVTLLIREIHPGFNLPLGVWFVRENLREMFSSKPSRFSSLEESLACLSRYISVPLTRWVATSRLLDSLRTQTKLIVPDAV